jgi:hypothetical protein
MNKPIPYAVAARIAVVLTGAMAELRALRNIADGSLDNVQEDPDAVPTATIAICERVHVMLDQRAIKMGAMPQGNYDIGDLLEPEAASDEGSEAANGS